MLADQTTFLERASAPPRVIRHALDGETANAVVYCLQ